MPKKSLAGWAAGAWWSLKSRRELPPLWAAGAGAGAVPSKSSIDPADAADP